MCVWSVCSAGGVATVVTTPGGTWPLVDPSRTRLLDPSCRPRETDGSRVLFEFQLDSCGTRAMVATQRQCTLAFLLYISLAVVNVPRRVRRTLSTRTKFSTMASWLQTAPASSPEDPSSSKEVSSQQPLNHLVVVD